MSNVTWGDNQHRGVPRNEYLDVPAPYEFGDIGTQASLGVLTIEKYTCCPTWLTGEGQIVRGTSYGLPSVRVNGCVDM